MPRRLRFYTILGGIALSLILLHLYLSTRIIDLHDKNTTLKIQLNELQGKNRKVEVLLEQKINLNALEKKARELRFENPDRIYYLLLPTREVTSGAGTL